MIKTTKSPLAVCRLVHKFWRDRFYASAAGETIPYYELLVFFSTSTQTWHLVYINNHTVHDYATHYMNRGWIMLDTGDCHTADDVKYFTRIATPVGCRTGY